MEQRVAYRFLTDLEADCRSCNRSWTARLRNISSTGCLILCPEPSLPDAALLRLRLRGLTAIDGQIVWQNRGHAGVRFALPLHKALMEHLGFRELESEETGAVRPILAPISTRPPSGLHARLVKRMWNEDQADKIVRTG